MRGLFVAGVGIAAALAVARMLPAALHWSDVAAARAGAYIVRGDRVAFERWLSTAEHLDVAISHPALEQFAEASHANDFVDPVVVVESTHLTPLMLATFYDRPEFVRRLLAAGAPVNSVSPGGQTALRLAKIYGRREIAHLLIDAVDQ